jgi:hypothetical protein
VWGGLLAEQMGLGKTLEVTALMLADKAAAEADKAVAVKQERSLAAGVDQGEEDVVTVIPLPLKIQRTHFETLSKHLLDFQVALIRTQLRRLVSQELRLLLEGGSSGSRPPAYLRGAGKVAEIN